MLIKGATLINEEKVFTADVRVLEDRIAEIGQNLEAQENEEVIDASGKYLLPGLIDDQVHFREPGLTHKATINSESRAAVAGGITSYMEMPNTVPNALTQELLQDKYDIAAKTSLANYSFFMGASNDNLEEVLKTDKTKVCGIKVFMGSSTGNMLVDDEQTLEKLFSNVDMLIATHCEDEPTIKANEARAREEFGEDVPIEQHPIIRSHEACYLSSSRAVAMARKYNTRLHILHISTARELDLFDNTIPLQEKRITSEACVHHLWFNDGDYEEKGTLIKWNPAVKTRIDQEAILEAVLDDRIDVIATDHAPHTLEEKGNTYFKAPSGGPLVQHNLVALLEFHKRGKISLEKIVRKACHNPAIMFDIRDRGFIREGYKADLVLVDPDKSWTVDRSNVIAKCGWSPFEGTEFSHTITHTFVNGVLAYENGRINEDVRGERLLFDR